MRKLLHSFAVAVAVASGLAVTACGDSGEREESVTREQVRQYLLNHPELVLDDPEIGNLINRTRVTRERKAATARRRSVLANHAELLRSPLTPSSGEMDSSVTFIEFYDYQCAPCKANYPDLEQVRKTEPNVRFLYAQLPIYGSHSIIAARAAIAAHRQGLFEAYHTALMTSDMLLDATSIYAQATAVGLDVEQLRNDMRDRQVLQYLEEIHLLAEELDVTGTPTFIVGDAMHRGGRTAAALKEELNLQRTIFQKTAQILD